MALDQLKAFLVLMQNDPGLKEAVLAASTADDVARIAAGLGYEFAGDELLRFSGQKVGRVTVSKQQTPGEYS
jgi:predicted ribosomally synthesized peptide with nif11-like leader|tara:strand:- start:404 stop:619 length:216 start_codon:yes stop_codon:yes gene_type:complete